MTTVTTVYAGTSVTTTATFTNPDQPATPVDPTTVTLKFRVSGGAVTTWTFGGSGSIVKVATGIYSAELDTTSMPGDWELEWIGTGTCAAVNVASFLVQAAPL